MENQTHKPGAWIGTVKVHRTRGRSRSYPTLRLPEAFLDLVGQTVNVAIAVHSVFINPPNGLSSIRTRYGADSPVEAPTRVQIPTRALYFCCRISIAVICLYELQNSICFGFKRQYAAFNVATFIGCAKVVYFFVYGN